MAGKVTGLRRLVNATGYSLAGLRAAWRHEAAFRQETMLLVVLLPAAFWLGRGPLDYALLVGSCLVVLVTELLNSAVEALTDRVGEEHHELSGRAKDLGSAAVFVSLVLVGVVWAGVAAARFL
ncbi:MAG: diacylglycerol kinase [Gammaproteobacteria bacterium]|nr:diacylglycerol kinase [Gammaproteobacteria bacterium]MBI5615571.1 diacylglycerol kinase [Gammaproteobacteria bacterium]